MMSRWFAPAILVLFLTTAVFCPGPSASGQALIRSASPQDAGQPINPNNTLYGWPNVYTGPTVGYFSATPNDPELAKLVNMERSLERDAAKLVKDYAGTEKESERTKLKTRIEEMLTKQFDAQQKRRDVELTRLETQVKRLRDLMKKRSEARQTIVDKRVDQLLREAEGLGWTAPRGLSTPAAQPLVPEIRRPIE
jgi:hypothetical protein